jgi:hypothetical protein
MNLIVLLAGWIAFGLFCLAVGAFFGAAAREIRQGLLVGLAAWGLFTFMGILVAGVGLVVFLTGGAS